MRTMILSPPALAIIEATVPPMGSASSSLTSVSLIAPEPSNCGASLTAVTVIDAVSLAALKAVVPPLVRTSTLVPRVPVVWSQAR